MPQKKRPGGRGGCVEYRVGLWAPGGKKKKKSNKIKACFGRSTSSWGEGGLHPWMSPQAGLHALGQGDTAGEAPSLDEPSRNLAHRPNLRTHS